MLLDTVSVKVWKNGKNTDTLMFTGPILESKGMLAIFQKKKGKKGQNILKFGQKCKKTKVTLKKAASCVRLSHA